MRVGSLFTGYGGLDMAVGGELSWVSEIDPAACRVIEGNHPGIPNLGDVSQVNWGTVPPVDVITAGYPCQPFSTAGNRNGTDDHRHLWPHVRDAVDALRPSHVVLENVRGHVTMGLADVIADLAGIGYDARWGVIRASDVGAPHSRARLFIVANPASNGHRWRNAPRGSSEIGRGVRAGLAGYSVPLADSESDGRSGQRASRNGRTGFADGNSGVDWGKYGQAITRWESVTGRPAPAPVVVRPGGKRRLSSTFAEWMMGLPAGHVTGRGLPYTAEIRLCGNGVVPQQARAAIDVLCGES